MKRLVGLSLMALLVTVSRAKETPVTTESPSMVIEMAPAEKPAGRTEEKAPVAEANEAKPVVEEKAVVESKPAAPATPVLESQGEGEELESEIEDDAEEPGWTTPRSRKQPVRLVLGPQFFRREGRTSTGMALGVSGRVAPEAPLYLGFDLAYFNREENGSRVHTVLPTLSTTFSFVDEGEARPYLGFGVGPALTVNGGNRRLDVTASIKIGLDLLLDEETGFNLEAGTVMVGRKHYFAPRANLLFRF